MLDLSVFFLSFNIRFFKFYLHAILVRVLYFSPSLTLNVLTIRLILDNIKTNGYNFVTLPKYRIKFCPYFKSLLPFIILKTLKFKYFFMFVAHTLLDRSFRVLKLPLKLSKLTAKR